MFARKRKERADLPSLPPPRSRTLARRGCVPTVLVAACFYAGHGQDVPTLEEASDVRRRLAATASTRELASGAWLGQEGLDLLQRCWHFVRSDAFGRHEAFHVCRGLLLVAYGALLTQPFAHVLELEEDRCEAWAYVGLPTHSFNWELKEFVGRFSEVGSALWPPLRSRQGGSFFHVGGYRQAVFARSQLLTWRPERIHIFEPVPEYVFELRRAWAGRYRNATIHNYGLANRTRLDVSHIIAGGSSSSFPQLRFSARRMYLDNVALRREVNFVTMRDTADAWRSLGIRGSLALLSLNCEGCEYEVLPALAAAGLMSKVETLMLFPALILNNSDVADEVRAERCDIGTGTCDTAVAYVSIARFCALQDLLFLTHRRVWGLPFNGFQLWEGRA